MPNEPTAHDQPPATPAPTASDERNPSAGGAAGVSKLGVLSVILGFVGIVLACPLTFLALPLPIIGLAIGLFALRNPNSRGVAIGGILISIVGVATILVLGIATVGMGGAAVQEDRQSETERWGEEAEPEFGPGTVEELRQPGRDANEAPPGGL